MDHLIPRWFPRLFLTCQHKLEDTSRWNTCSCEATHLLFNVANVANVAKRVTLGKERSAFLQLILNGAGRVDRVANHPILHVLLDKTIGEAQLLITADTRTLGFPRL